jgi:hypothetical protein
MTILLIVSVIPTTSEAQRSLLRCATLAGATHLKLSSYYTRNCSLLAEDNAK